MRFSLLSVGQDVRIELPLFFSCISSKPICIGRCLNSRLCAVSVFKAFTPCRRHVEIIWLQTFLLRFSFLVDRLGGIMTSFDAVSVISTLALVSVFFFLARKPFPLPPSFLLIGLLRLPNYLRQNPLRPYKCFFPPFSCPPSFLLQHVLARNSPVNGSYHYLR